eukprot:CAMPEP_0194525460 /NCGR_PEP_ID=MMETSP0253-20130528/60938_1 /TAXON_ID=2966 /ORGANISM="Noctiluca scintillans" /LENGTH=408 /DNA_ID=CAMNT_0039370193 /DNA_START=114 /DNA_END=1341 /DNA_ORIENTATION=-
MPVAETIKAEVAAEGLRTGPPEILRDVRLYAVALSRRTNLWEAADSVGSTQAPPDSPAREDSEVDGEERERLKSQVSRIHAAEVAVMRATEEGKARKEELQLECEILRQRCCNHEKIVQRNEELLREVQSLRTSLAEAKRAEHAAVQRGLHWESDCGRLERALTTADKELEHEVSHVKEFREENSRLQTQLRLAKQTETETRRSLEEAVARERWARDDSEHLRAQLANANALATEQLAKYDCSELGLNLADVLPLGALTSVSEEPVHAFTGHGPTSSAQSPLHRSVGRGTSMSSLSRPQSPARIRGAGHTSPRDPVRDAVRKAREQSPSRSPASSPGLGSSSSREARKPREMGPAVRDQRPAAAARGRRGLMGGKSMEDLNRKDETSRKALSPLSARSDLRGKPRGTS